MRVIKLKLAEMLEKREMSVKDFALKIGVSTECVYMWKNGKKAPGLFSIEVMLQALDCELTDLLEFVEV